MASKEGMSGILVFAVGINLFNIGMFIGRNIGESQADASDRIEDIQAYNSHVYEQLEPGYNGLGRLVLNDETDTFEFRVSPEGEQPQTCQGEYEVTDGSATVVGQIACTTTTEVGGN